MKAWRRLGWMLALVVAGCAPDTNRVYEEGVLALKQGRPAEAVQKMNQVLKLRPDYPPAYEQRGIAYLKLGDIKTQFGI